MVSINLNIQKKDLWLLSAIIVFLVGVTVVVAWGSTPNVHGHDAGEVEGIIETFDSGWFAVTGGTTYTKNHGLGTTPLMAQLWYSNTIDGSGDVVLRGATDWDTAQNVLSIVDMDSTSIKIRSSSSRLVAYADSSGTLKFPTSGYARIVAMA